MSVAPIELSNPPSPAGTGRPSGRVAVAVVRLSAPGDGVAYVARLIQRALLSLDHGPPRIIELAPRSAARPSRREQLRFLTRLVAAQANFADWTLFAHLGLARAQRWVPRPVRRPHAIFLHGIEAWDPALSAGRLAALRSARVRVANSSYTASRVMAAHSDVGQVVVCPLALDPADMPTRHTHDDQTDAAPDDLSVVIIGRMSAAERYKGHDQLIACWPSVVRSVPNARLVIIGTGDDAKRLQSAAAASGVGDRITFTGFVPDAARDAFLRRAAVYAMPSTGEGFGIVYLQAMRAGVPCVGSRADAAGDLIVDGSTGFLVDQEDAQALAGRLVELLTNRSLRRRMGEAGRRRYSTEFTFERFQDRLLAALAPMQDRAMRLQ